MKYSIGLDIGISSVGWAVINLDKDRIQDLGVRMFDVAENPKNGSSLAAPRREARSSRRTTRRRRYRVGRVRKMIVDKGLLSQAQADQLYDWKDGDIDVWLIRVNALERKLSDREFARILIHYAKNRGFKSNRKSEANEEEGGRLLQAVKANRALMESESYRTVAEMLMLDEKFAGRKRNKDGDYSHVIARSEIEQEIHTVFEEQRRFGHPFAIAENEDAYIRIWASQRPFASQDDITKKIGVCTFEPNEKRAPKFSYTFERFRAMDKINRLRIISDRTPQRPMTNEERDVIMDKLMDKKEVKYKDLRKTLNLQDHERFNELFYDLNKTNTENENKVFLSLQGIYKMKQAVKATQSDAISESMRPIDYDTFGYALTVYKDDQDIYDYLKNIYVNENGKTVKNLANQAYDRDLISELMNLSFSKFGHLSFKALHNIMPYIEQGDQYHEACEKAGYHFNQRIGTQKESQLPVIPTQDIANPVVIRSLTQTRKVVNAIIKRYGAPSYVHIEMARDMGRHYSERKELEKQYNNNRKHNDNAKNHIRDLHPQANPRGHDILKFKLWEEQNGCCAYSMKPIPMDNLLDIGYAEVDHIIPYSRSFDDSNANKVLVLTQENQNKRNQTPFEWFGNDTAKWDEFTSYVNTLKVRKKKKNLLLKKNFDNEEAEQFKSRHLNDTRYITRFLKGYIEDNLQFREIEGVKQHVFTVNGAYTSLMRKRWGFNKNREESDLHHALDAAIVAVSLANRDKVSRYFKRREEHASQLLKREGEHFPEPWEGFRREVEARMVQDIDQLKLALESLSMPNYDEAFINEVNPIFVSRMPKRSIKGQIHEETLRRHRGYDDKGFMRVVTKTSLKDIPFDKNTGDFPMYGKESDPKTYQAIKERYLEYGGKKEKAFKETLLKPSKKMDKAPVIRSVKIESTTNRAFALDEHTVAANGSIARTEVYRHKHTGKFYLAPVYVSEVMAGESPKKFITQSKPYNEWVNITEEFEFQFNLFQNDVIKIKMPREKTSTTYTKEKVSWTEDFFYYKGVDTATAQIKIVEHKNKFEDRVGPKGLKGFEKYQTDPLGNLTKVNKEKRHGV